ncbi:MAG: hypothetical protein GY865_02005 [candidate division Zixibacteria bacterium]|nr:hypothetical protein [candidate division Zixibacteria bacterium]
MDCDRFKKRISQRVGYISCDADDKIHLEQCPECQKLYDKYISLENELKDMKIKPLDSIGFAMVQQKLDNRINLYQRRAVSFYNVLTHYGAGLVTVVFLFFVSLWSGFEYGVYYSENSDLTNAYYFADNGYDDSDEDETINEEYIGLLLYDYTQSNGFDAGNQLLGELTADEFEYLENNLDLGDIL